MQTSLAFFQNQRVGTCTDDTDSLSWVLDASHLDHLGPTVCRLLHQFCIAELVLGKRLDVGDGFAACRFRDEVDFVSLNVFDNHDLQLREEVEGKIGHGISENGLLDEEDVAAGLLDAFTKVEEVLSFLFEDLVHLSVIIDNDLVVHLWVSQVDVESKANARRVSENSVGTESVLFGPSRHA